MDATLDTENPSASAVAAASALVEPVRTSADDAPAAPEAPPPRGVAGTGPVFVAPTQLAAVLDLYERGRMVDAYELARRFGPPPAWRGRGARVLAGRLAMNLGAPKLGAALHRLAYREDPADPEAVYFYARNVFDRRGPLDAWEFLRARGDDLPGGADDVRSDWFALHGMVLAWVRDFGPAEQWLGRATALTPDRPWIWIERCELLEKQDRYPEALAAARKALELRPYYRPAVQAAAHTLQLLDRDGEALELLTEAVTHIQSAPVVAHLAMLQTELGRHEEARASLERVVALSPLLEPAFARYLAAKRADAAYYCGDVEAAVRLGRESKNAFHEKVADKLDASKGLGRRVLLPVPFVRQHHHTCAPATLAALSRYWSVPAEHLGVAEQICYDGTPAHGERQWAERAGYAAREFDVTWDAAAALIDRGVPFTLTTVEAASAHLQACIGYDSVRGTLLIRDPFQRVSGEFIAEPFFERYKSTGPRGMVMVPADKAHLLDGVDLPAADLYDAFYDVQRSLVAHRRADANAAYAALCDKAPGHRLTLNARRSLAAYDGNATDGLAAVEALLGLFPDDPNLLLSKLGYLRGLGRRDERLALLRGVCDKKGTDPVFWSQLAEELKDDAREHAAAVALLRKSLRSGRLEAATYCLLAGLRWDERRFADAVPLYRFAMTLEDKRESFARAFFVAARHVKQTEEALRLMRDRFDRFGRKSPWPAATLAWAFEELDRAGEALGVLDEALALRPDDGDLLLVAADAHGRRGAFDRAEGLLGRAKDKCRPTAWLRGSAEIAVYRGDTPRAMDLWRRVLADEPLAVDAHRHLARMLAETQGRAAALAHLQAACDRFPHSYPLHQLWIEYLRDEGPEAAEAAIRRLIAIHPADPWARREVIWTLAARGRLDEAMAEADEALRLDPSNPSSHFFKGKVLAKVGRPDEARAAFRTAIGLSVDADYAIGELMGTCEDVAARREALAFVRGELVRQTIFGDGLLAYRAVAAETLPADELLAELREALAARPDLWHAWSAVVRQLTDADRLDEAERTAREACDRFPLLPRVWLDLAGVRRVRNDAAGETAALEKALQISPGWTVATRQLADGYERAGRFDRSKALLESAVARSPLEAQNHGGLADALWKLGEREAAVEAVKRAVQLEPGYTWAWESLRRWTNELGKPAVAAEQARALTTTKAGEARSWLVLARTLNRPEDLDERLAALSRAAELNPRAVEAHEQRGRLLAEAGRFDEAAAACRPAAFGDRPPLELRGRAAWVAARRGDLAGAVGQMRALLAEDPIYYWGWANLCDWLQRTDTDEGKAESLAAATEMARLWPHDPPSLGRLGDARHAAGDKAGAKAAWRRAVDVAPDYDYGAASLFDACAEDGDLAGAAAALELLRVHSPGPYTVAREVELACKTGDRDAAVRGAAGLCVAPMPDDLWPLRAAVDWAAKAGWDRDLEAPLVAAARDPAAHDWIGGWLAARWAKWHGGAADARTAAKVEELEPCGDVGVSATRTWLRMAADEALAEIDRPVFRRPAGQAARRLFGHLRGKPTAALRAAVRDRRAYLRAHPSLWGMVGYAFQTVRDYRAVLDWLSDWQARPGVEAWMVVNIAESLRAFGRDAEAHPINERGRKLSTVADDPNGVAIHTLWLAADAALGPDPASARAILDGTDFSQLGGSYQFLLGMVEATLAVVTSDRPRAAMGDARGRIAAAVAKHPKFTRDVELRRAYRRCLRRIAAADVGAGGRAWCWKRIVRPV